MHRWSLACECARECEREASSNGCESELLGYHSFALERAAGALLMTVPWNYCGTSRPVGKVRARLRTR